MKNYITIPFKGIIQNLKLCTHTHTHFYFTSSTEHYGNNFISGFGTLLAVQ